MKRGLGKITRRNAAVWGCVRSGSRTWPKCSVWPRRCPQTGLWTSITGRVRRNRAAGASGPGARETLLTHSTRLWTGWSDSLTMRMARMPVWIFKCWTKARHWHFQTEIATPNISWRAKFVFLLRNCDHVI